MKIRTHVPLRPYTTFDIGGEADFFSSVKTLEDLKEAWNFSQHHELARIVIGGGSNLLVSERGVAGMVIHIVYDRCEFKGTDVRVGAGCMLDECVGKTIECGLRGMESLSGIPGTVGGAVYGNAGAWGKSVGDVIAWVRCFNGSELKEFSKNECAFGYRTSVFKQAGEGVIWEIGCNLETGDRAPLRNTRQAILAYRSVRYPRRAKSAGSFFKNVSATEFSEDLLSSFPSYAFSGNEISAGYLIEQAGLLGMRSGGLYVCPHQGNFLINKGHGDSNNVITLARTVQSAVHDRFGVILEPEVRCVGFTENPFS
ncbi:MAG: UDP-N-acetylenolpyruvoylglucosamine reductase [Parcubacteria group bacterium GW2011_GWB1_46_8]|nr:MAG: UDP-N-acetylenolpyruvoylglucosamine reductase [Parcubacteria group bacterium GW2011_GWF1_45_5]KKU11415.1 MAG: UDP-N-acetylenolpyruvoylglucosamine reductase [Parcubacteria group bacterium GW2011_GWA1_45_7]KKU43400.1 MAG: UDP-N-acetylenolpyruvoylglucosamine reductase [Parcubacteria group bacterium GW2011_GWA2_46_7]KKU46368.1 MAG: UDP-N-acetylenolpyruvoylglucosamine reductase [Parcubacteria group bacterium GW2011_GWB1_46_8]KKU47745.1 MAG: UDP-N-acetylenolpyruvoylglucosamine reductase [Parc